MQAVILAAGEGKRMQPLTLERPKPLIEVVGLPLIEHVLRALPSEVSEVLIIVGYKAEMIMDHLGEEYQGKKIRFVHQDKPAGTAHALSLAQPFLIGKFLLLNADDIIGTDSLAEAVTYPLALLVAHHTEPQKMGVVSVTEEGMVQDIVEKPEQPASDLVSTGSMVLDERIFAYPAPLQENGEYYLTDSLTALAAEHPMKAVEQTLWIPVGYPEDIPKAEEKLQRIEENVLA